MKRPSVWDMADYFIALSNTTENLITNMQLQKLLYYAQAWHLAITERPMFEAEFQAWVHGPVIPAVYGQYKQFSWRPIERSELGEADVERIKRMLPEDSRGVLDEVTEQYFGVGAYELERLVHGEEPWKRARAGLAPDEPSHEVIRNEWMRDFYSQYLSDEQTSQ
jgi:uncharacterized phage-associated protein